MTSTYSRFAVLRGGLIAMGLGGALLLQACGGGGGSKATPSPAAGSNNQAQAGTTGSTSQGSTDQAKASGSSNGDVDACKLVSKADAEKALGEPVKAGEPEVSGLKAKTYSCTYVSEGNYSAHVVLVQVTRGGDQKQTYDFARKAYKEVTDVKGIGDEAFSVQLGAPVSQIHVRKGDTFFSIVMTQISENGRPAEGRALAQLVASRL